MNIRTAFPSTPAAAPGPWSTREVVRSSGVSSRTLRHYHQIGLLVPSGAAASGERSYDVDDLVRLQQILVLRRLGLGLPAITRMLDGQQDAAAGLRQRISELDEEAARIARQRATVQATLEAIDAGVEPLLASLFSGFDHAEHRAEVTRRWGPESYAASAAWFEGLSEAERTGFQREQADLVAGWQELAADGADPAGRPAQELAGRQAAWLSVMPGTPAQSGDAAQAREYIRCMGELYAADPRFTASMGGAASAALIRDALAVWSGTPAPTPSR